MEFGDKSERLLSQAMTGDTSDFGSLLERYRKQLTRIVKIRMDRRLQSRIDAADVVQDAFIEATQRFPDYIKQQQMPFFLWLRFITIQKLMQLHRFHLGTRMRDAGREVSMNHAPAAQATSAVLAAQLLGNLTSPTQAVKRAEEKQKLEQALNELDEKDREVLILRHFERLSVKETAQLLSLSESGTSSRYFRAIDRLRSFLK